MSSHRYAFVVPRFGRDIFGGAETLVADLARHLGERGDKIEVWTTTAKDNRTWEDHYPAGEYTEDLITIRRFKVDSRNLDVWIPKQIAISQGLMLTVDAELEWLKHSVNSTALYSYIAKNSHDFRAVFFAPYLFGTTFWGSLINPGKSVLIPCLHDESYARTVAISSMFKQVRGCLFNARGEQYLAQSLYGLIKGEEVGMGFDSITESEILNSSPFFDEDFDYILCLGRKETGKNSQTLIDYFIEGKERKLLPSNLKLVIAGAGDFKDLERPGAVGRDDIVDIGHTTEQQKRSLIRHSLCVCQPSLNESFSIIIMEAWLLLKPVLVHAGCAVTRDHVTESGGGLYFADFQDFVGCIRQLCESDAIKHSLAEAGQRYVLEKYSWDAVMGRFDKTLDMLFSISDDTRSISCQASHDWR